MQARTSNAGHTAGEVLTSGATVPMPSRLRRPRADYLTWLEARSMLYQAEQLSDLIAGTHHQWQNAYAHPRPLDFVRAASVWFTSYPQSIITRRDKSVLQTLASDDLLSTFRTLGIEGIHTGPMKRAGAISGRRYTPSIDGFFDRIELTIDPRYGSNDEYVEMTRDAQQFGIVIIGDLVPGHTGKGADFRLAERAYKNYDGLYTMIEIPQGDWVLLPPVPEGADSVNLSLETVQRLEDVGYIPGPLDVVIFYDPNIKETNWSATDIVTGVDGVQRRWVYLHVFKAGQPSFNWLDPTFGAHRIVIADAVQSLHVLGAKALRLDANPLLGIEGRPGLEKAWIEGHPLAEGTSNTIAMMIRKLGGYSFQELNLSLDDLKRFTKWGPELSYDFFTRPPYLFAMVTGDAGPLRLILRLMLEEGIEQGILVHALQNHDELMFDLAHMRNHGDEKFWVNGEEMLGRTIYDSMYQKVKDQLITTKTPYIRDWSTPGFCGTLAGFAAAALSIHDPFDMTASQKSEVQRLHFLVAVFNAMQPGVFALSGWDLVGALPVSPESLGSWMDDGDGRWTNRGAYDLIGVNPRANASRSGLPRSMALYGTLTEQLRDPSSFASQLRQMLQVRKESGIAFSKCVAVPETDNAGVLAILFEHAEDSRWSITVLNFGRDRAHGSFELPQLANKSADLIYSTQNETKMTVPISQEGRFPFNLEPLRAEVFNVK